MRLAGAGLGAALLLYLSLTGELLARNAASVITVWLLLPTHQEQTPTPDGMGQLAGLIRPVLAREDDAIADRAHLAMGLLHHQAGRAAEAIEEWRLAGSGPLWEHLAAQAWREGRPAAAISLYERAIAVDPNRQVNYFTLAWIYWPALGQVANAVDIYARVTEVATPGSAEWYRAQGYMFRFKEDWGQARDMFAQALLADPLDVDAYRQAATAAERLGAVEMAINYLQEAVHQLPNDHWTVSWLYLEMGDVSIRAGQLAQAASWYAAAQQADGSNPALGPRQAALAQATAAEQP